MWTPPKRDSAQNPSVRGRCLPLQTPKIRDVWNTSVFFCQLFWGPLDSFSTTSPIASFPCLFFPNKTLWFHRVPRLKRCVVPAARLSPAGLHSAAPAREAGPAGETSLTVSNQWVGKDPKSPNGWDFQWLARNCSNFSWKSEIWCEIDSNQQVNDQIWSFVQLTYFWVVLPYISTLFFGVAAIASAGRLPRKFASGISWSLTASTSESRVTLGFKKIEKAKTAPFPAF